MASTIQWSTVAAMPTARYGLGAARDSQGRIYAMGGYGSAGVLKTVERFDPSTGAWTTLASMPTARYVLAAAADAQGRIYVIGGYNSSGAVLNIVERFDPTTGAWTTLAPLPAARAGLAAATDAQGRIYAIGGTPTAATAYRYDPSTGLWSTLTSMPTARSVLAAAADAQGRIYAIGGSASGTKVATVERFDPSTSAWSTLAAMPTARSDLTAAADSQGRIYAIGGNTTSELATVERFDPSTGAWTVMTPLTTARADPAAATDTQGRIYVLGGMVVAGSQPLATAERGNVNASPNAPILTSPATNAPIARGDTNRFAWTFSDPDPGDSQSSFDLQYRVVNTTTWTTVSAPTPNTFYDFAPGTFALGNYEWQVRTYDAIGAQGPFSASGFFTAADAPPAPTITAPVNGSTVVNTATVTWSTAGQTDYQVRRVADNAGAANTAVVYSDTGDVVDASTRSITVAFDTNNRSEHVQVRIKKNLLWSSWADARVQVSYTPPTTPAFTMTGDPATATRTLTITNPAPGAGVPATAYNDVYCRTAAASTVLDTYRPYSATGTRIATALATNAPFIDRTTAGDPVVYEYRVVAVASNATTSDSGWVSTA